MNVEDLELPIEQLDASAMSLISRLAAEYRESVAALEALEQQVSAVKQQIEALETQRIPDAMAELGLKELRLATGHRLGVEPEYHASIPKKYAPQAMSWLRENEFGDLIKNKVVIEFNKEQDADAQRIYEQLRLQFSDNRVERTEAVHPQTLKALVKEQFNSGSPMPEDLFGVYIINRAKLSSKE